MSGKVQSKTNELAKRRAIIQLIGMAIEGFDRSLTDSQKIAMFAMTFDALQALQRNVSNATSGMQVSRMMALALTAPVQEVEVFEPPVEEKTPPKATTSRTKAAITRRPR